MRHLERTHGISIQWMHEIFQNDLIYLVYEITSKMCADIHTKAFKDHMTWKRACMLINILSYDEISSDCAITRVRRAGAKHSNHK